MKVWLAQCLSRGARAVLGLRYRVRLVGEIDLRGSQRATLILPNHPAYVDPALVLSFVRKSQRIRPLVYEKTYRNWLLRPLMWWLQSVEVPELAGNRKENYRRAQEMIEQVLVGLAEQQSFLVFPSGRLQRGTTENLGGASLVHKLLQRSPDVDVILVRIRGVWGSRFSCARTGDVPPLTRTLLTAVGLFFANACLFLPRRDVTLTIHRWDPELWKSSTRHELNRMLEAWYNDDGGEGPRYLPYFVRIPRQRSLRIPRLRKRSSRGIGKRPAEPLDAGDTHP